jgi:hypothetical protein
MSQQSKILDLAQSMEQTMEIGNLSMITDVGEAIMDSALDDGILKDIPILGSIVGAGKCIKNISDVLFTNKLIAFLTGLKDAGAEERKAAILKWEDDAKYRMRVGEALLNMINRCDDTQKAQWLSKLFYELVLKQQRSELFMRAEKVLSAMSVMDVMSFLDLPQSTYENLSLEKGEPYANSGLYRINAPNGYVAVEVLRIKNTTMRITEVGKYIYMILNSGAKQ